MVILIFSCPLAFQRKNQTRGVTFGGTTCHWSCGQTVALKNKALCGDVSGKSIFFQTKGESTCTSVKKPFAQGYYWSFGVAYVPWFVQLKWIGLNWMRWYASDGRPLPILSSFCHAFQTFRQNEPVQWKSFAVFAWPMFLGRGRFSCCHSLLTLYHSIWLIVARRNNSTFGQ